MSNSRVTVSYRFAVIAVSLLMATSLTACKADNNYFETSNSSVGGTDGSSVDATAGFRVRLISKTGVEGFMHKFGNIADACEISLTTIATGTPTSIQCMLNMMEYDLWFYGFQYEFNVPKNTCEFVTISPNTHYKLLPGRGPSTLSVVQTDGLITSCLIDGIAGTVSGGLCSGIEGSITVGGAISCDYDYSKTLTGGLETAPNCCFGPYTANVTTIITTTAPPTVSTTSTTGTYTGSPYNCGESPHDFIENWPKFKAVGLSVPKASTLILETGGTALVKTTKVPSPESLFNLSKKTFSYGNFMNAGFHDWAAYAANPATWDTARTIPRSFVPLKDRGPLDDHGLTATDIPDASDGSEDFRCLNAAGEVKYQIRMYVNEWNTREDYDNYKASGVASGADPTVTGVPGVNCSAVNLGQSCNTIWGYDDMLNAAALGPAAYVFPYSYEDRRL